MQIDILFELDISQPSQYFISNELDIFVLNLLTQHFISNELDIFVDIALFAFDVFVLHGMPYRKSLQYHIIN